MKRISLVWFVRNDGFTWSGNFRTLDDHTGLVK